MPPPYTPNSWLDANCPLIDGQFVFLDPLWWDTHLLSAGAVEVLRQAASAIESGAFDAFASEVEAVGGWPPGLERLARALTTLQHADPDEGSQN